MFPNLCHVLAEVSRRWKDSGSIIVTPYQSLADALFFLHPFWFPPCSLLVLPWSRTCRFSGVSLVSPSHLRRRRRAELPVCATLAGACRARLHRSPVAGDAERECATAAANWAPARAAGAPPGDWRGQGMDSFLLPSPRRGRDNRSR
jgi:hypothetical protein